MSVSDGQPVNASVTNAAYMSRLNDTSTVGAVDLENVSYTDLIHLQRIINEMLASLGMSNQAATDAAADTYSSNNVVTNTDRKTAIGQLDERFNGTTGHTHDGTDGEGAPISATNLADFNNLFAEFGEYTFDAASGSSIDVSSLFSGQTSGGDSSTAGVITSAPNNYISLLEKTTGGEIEDADGDRVFARLTESGGTWTLSFFTNEAGTETAHTLSSQDIRFLYREVFTAADRPTIGANVGVYDTQSAVGDIPDASASQRGVVSTGSQTFQGAKNFLLRPTVNSNDVVDVSTAQVITFKDIDGGVASNTSRVTLPKNTTANLTGLTRKEGTVFYDTDEQNFFGDNGTDIIPLGGGAGGGGLDVWHTEDFEDTVASDFTSGNNATFGVAGTFNGTLADETVSPIASASSLKFTQAVNSLNDWFKSPTINIDNKQSGNTTGITLYFTYDGDASDISFVFYDETNSNVLTSSLDLFTSESNPTRYSTSVSIPSTCTSVSWGAQVEVENIGAVLIVDDVEFSTNPFVYKEIIERQQLEFLGDSSTMTSRAAGSDLRWGTLTESGDGGIISYDDSNGRFTALKDCEVNVAWSALSGTTVLFDTRKNGNVIVRSAAPATYETTCGTTVSLAAGDYITMRTAIVLTGPATLQFVAEADNESVITPSRVGRTYTEDNGDFTITDTNWTTNKASAVYYKTSDGTHRLKFNFDGSYSGKTATNLYSLTFSGVTFANLNQAIAGHDENMQSRASDQQASFYTLSNTSTVRMQTSSSFDPNNSWSFSGDVELVSKPTWADEVSSQYLAAVPVQQTCYVKDVKSSGTNGGTFTSGSWQTRDLNTSEGDTEIVSVSSNQFTLQAGVYNISAEARCMNCRENKLRLQNTTDASTAIIGMTEDSGGVSDANSPGARLKGRVEITSAKTFELQHRGTSTQASVGFGTAASFGVDEVYTQIEITKVR